MAPSSRINCFLCKKNVEGSELNPLGLPSKCTHSFCASCLLAYYEHPQSDKACPVCAVPGTPIVSAEDIKDIGARSQLAELQERVVKANLRARQNRRRLAMERAARQLS